MKTSRKGMLMAALICGTVAPVLFSGSAYAAEAEEKARLAAEAGTEERSETDPERLEGVNSVPAGKESPMPELGNFFFFFISESEPILARTSILSPDLVVLYWAIRGVTILLFPESMRSRACFLTLQISSSRGLR